MSALAAAVQFQPDWWSVLQTDFMRNALIGGSLVAVAAGLLGYFVVTRSNAFAAHALAHIGFPGATGAILVGAPITLGLAVFCVGGGLLIGLLGRRVAEREIATGTVLAFATGLGVLFGSLASANASTTTSVLFGNLLAVSDDELVVFALFTAAVALVLAVIARPLVFASIDPAVAEARGVPVRALGVAFVVLLALTITMAVQVVGTLLLFALVVTPAATGLRLTARPGRVAAIAVGIALLSVWTGLVLAAMFDLPPSFVIVTTSVLIWVGVLAGTRRPRRAHLAPAHPGGHDGSGRARTPTAGSALTL
ncbi:metal ABC transporter permease [Trujillonella endophytica]|uniref:Zinc/manganese transport system permease protein n=1 Tax=Trujillonella endophytica TaxID=673521 RepID=A0A1H8UEP2_9ACTN|nr:metal ABC transporter permease [Trujillella endophytica]SEP01353.1 zinc/manganese transport system permease protein [Trujillella endophytica]